MRKILNAHMYAYMHTRLHTHLCTSMHNALLPVVGPKRLNSTDIATERLLGAVATPCATQRAKTLPRIVFSWMHAIQCNAISYSSIINMSECYCDLVAPIVAVACCRLLLAVCIGCFCCCHNNISDFNQICSWQRCRAVHSTKGHCENKEDLLFAYCTAQRFVLSKWVICCMQRLHKYITPLHLWRVKVIELLWESLSNCFMLMQ